jgi:hypothetical protein
MTEKKNVLYIWEINRSNTHSSFLHANLYLHDVLLCKVVYDNNVYRHKYIEDFVKVGVKLYNL